MDPTARPTRLTVLHWLLVVITAAATLWLISQVLTKLMVVTAAVVAAALLTALLEPLVRRMVGLGLPRWLASLLTLLGTLAALVAFGYVLVGRVADQSEDLRGALRETGERLRSWVLDSPLPVSASQLDEVPQRLQEGMSSIVPAPLTGAGIAVDVVSALALSLFLWFFMLKDGPRILPWVLSWMPRPRRAPVQRSGELAWDVLTRYVRGTVVIAFADAVGAGVVMAVLGVPLTLSLAVLVFLGAFVPIIGSTVAGAIAVAVTLVTVGPVQALVLVGAVIVVQQLEGNLLQPLIMGRALHLHPAVVVLSVTVGAIVAGVLGALVAMPVVAIAYGIADDLARPEDGTDSTAAGDDLEDEPAQDRGDRAARRPD